MDRCVMMMRDWGMLRGLGMVEEGVVGEGEEGEDGGEEGRVEGEEERGTRRKRVTRRKRARRE